MKNFTRNDNADLNGTSLQIRLMNLSRTALVGVFGTPLNGIELEKGYKEEYTFVSDDGTVVSLYDRWGMWRIGAKCMEDAEQFKLWLEATLPNG
jgi:hypothetical protein